MREYFLLALRVIGVLCLLAGLMLVFQGILLLLFGLTMPGAGTPPPSEPWVDDMLKPLVKMTIHCSVWLFLFPVINGFLLMILGGYLLRARNPLPLNVCYPAVASATEVRANVKSGKETRQSPVNKTDNHRFMPGV